MKKLLFSLFLLFSIISNKAISQMYEKGVPFSSNNKCPVNIRKAVIPTITFPKMKNDSLQSEEKKSDIFIFGYILESDIGLKNTGKWDTLPDGSKLWRVRIVSPSAYGILLYFDDFKIPVGAKFFVYNADKTEIKGAFTEKNNDPSKKFAVDVIKGNTVVLEYHEPANSSGSIHIDGVTHVYKDLFRPGSGGGSLSCEKDVSCNEGVGWEDQINSVVMITVPMGVNVALGTGVMLNNAKKNDMPFVMTAFHMADENDDCALTTDETNNMANWIFKFHYQRTTCGDASTTDNGQSVTGAEYLTAYEKTDFLLVRLKNCPPLINVYLAGWDSRGTTPSGTTIIHHPEGDVKKISVDNDVLTIGTSNWTSSRGGCSRFYTNFWNANLDIGTVEKGSSGAPWFENSSHLIVGVTSTTSGTNCTNKGDAKGGKFSETWSSVCLGKYLDPDATGITFLTGMYMSGNCQTAIQSPPIGGLTCDKPPVVVEKEKCSGCDCNCKSSNKMDISVPAIENMVLFSKDLNGNVAQLKEAIINDQVEIKKIVASPAPKYKGIQDAIEEFNNVNSPIVDATFRCYPQASVAVKDYKLRKENLVPLDKLVTNMIAQTQSRSLRKELIKFKKAIPQMEGKTITDAVLFYDQLTPGLGNK